MCGIAGIINLSGQSPDIKNNIRLMTNTIRHRGPDGEGFLLSNNDECIALGGPDTPEEVYKSGLAFAPQQNIDSSGSGYNMALGHRRLSIIDLSPGGHQPMSTPDKSLWIVYNGEIYNYIELRDELKSKGHQFNTNSDTEVILNAYREWGTGCLNRFNGMWAFVIYDKNKNELFAARDRFGVKPFYYYKDENAFAFASEQKALVKLPFIKKEINPKAVFDFFSKNETEYEEEGMFKSIIELFPSHAFRLNLKTKEFNKWRYYSLPVNEQYQIFDESKFNSASEHVKELLVNAVTLRLRSDIGIGSCLSGGLDSSVIVGIINHLLFPKGWLRHENSSINVGERLKVFTASFKDSKYDESNWAKKMVDHTGAEWQQTFPESAGLLKDLEDLIYSQDIPIWSTSTYAQHRVMQLAKESGIKVVLDGQGGDELFAGYDTYNVALGMEQIKNFKVPDILNWSAFIKQYLRFYGIKKLPAGVKAKFYEIYYPDIKYLNKDFWNEHKNRLEDRSKDSQSLNGTLYSEFYNTRLKTYLKCEDRCSMWHSVEARTPFADDINLIEYTFQQPGTFKIHNGIYKYLLRESAKDFIPDAIKNRKDKMGYLTPNNKWISEIHDDVKNLFTGRLSEYVHVDLIKKDYDEFFNIEDQTDRGRTFKFISFAQWVKAFDL